MACPVNPAIVPSPRDKRLRAISGLALIASRACRSRAFPEAYCSKHPRAPQPHKWPSGTTRRWPNSAAIPKAPRNNSPLRTIPPPIPVPTVNIIMWFWLRPAPNLASPHAAAFASFSITTGKPINADSSASRLTPFQSAMLGVASIVLRSDETNPAAETPIAAIVCSDISSIAVSAIVWVNALPPWRGVSLRAVAIIFPFSSTTPPKTFVPPTSMPIVYVTELFL